ncbi:MAG: thermonuclease family protein [Nanoarchaeota archaeon]|nr:thermonuclease family protein [Nanoarchaeota archaeon]
MEKRHAFLIALLITLLVAGNYLFFYDFSSDRETVVIGRVIDGDTVELEDGRKIRLLNVNAPERGEFGYDSATEFIKDFENKTLELEISGVGRYGRILGRLYYDEYYINLNLVKNGLAHPYIVSDREVKDFKKAEKEARENEKGIWGKSEHYGCLNVEINKYDEYVVIEDKCGVDFDGWKLKDESTRSYKLDKVNSRRFVLYSEKGIDGKDEFYWGRGNAWNDDKDSIFVRDEKGKLVYYDSYGY